MGDCKPLGSLNKFWYIFSNSFKEGFLLELGEMVAYIDCNLPSISKTSLRLHKLTSDI
jgi:hypothetical protein